MSILAKAIAFVIPAGVGIAGTYVMKSYVAPAVEPMLPQSVKESKAMKIVKPVVIYTPAAVGVYLGFKSARAITSGNVLADGASTVKG